jgi:hypothetical protein
MGYEGAHGTDVEWLEHPDGPSLGTVPLLSQQKGFVIGLSMQPPIQVSLTGLLTATVDPSPAWDRTKQRYLIQRFASYSNGDQHF